MEHVQGFDLDGIATGLTTLISSWGLSVVVVLVVGWIVARSIRGRARRALDRTGMDATLVPFVSNRVYYLNLAFVIIAVLGLFGIPTTSFIAVLGAAGLAVGLALQGTLSNFAGGVMLLLFRPFRVGDYIEATGTEGSVQEISEFSTALDTLDKVRIVLPNSAVWGQTIKNFTRNEERRDDMTIGISYGDDIDRAEKIVRDTLAADPRVLEAPEPLVVVKGLGESSVDLLVGPWCKPTDYWGLRFDLFQTIKENLEAGGCHIPFPQRDVHVFQVNRSSTAA